jgi:hypothetical protein
MHVSLRPLVDGDLDAIYAQMTDPGSVRMAAFVAGDLADRDACLSRIARARADPSAMDRVIDADGVIAGTIADERPIFARAASDNAASLRVLEKAGFRRIGVDSGFANGRSEEIEETILRLD